MTDIRRDLVTLLPRLRRFALTLTGAVGEADELARDVCNRAIQKSHHWKGEGRIEHWLFSMMRSICHDDARKRRRSDPVAAVPLVSETPTDNVLQSLPAGLSSAVLLADVERFSYVESAAILGIPVDAFTGRLCAARLRLAAIDQHASERRA